MGTRGDDERDARRARPRRKDLRRALADAVEGFQALERDVEVDGRRAADVLGVDGDGRAWLAVLVRGERGLVRTLEALALAHGGAGPLERLVRATGEGGAGLDPARAPGVVVIVSAEDVALVERLAPLVALDVRLVTVSGLAGRSARLIVARAARRARGANDIDLEREVGDEASAGGRPGFGTFLAALPPAEAERAARVLRRLARLDDGLASDVRADAVHVSIDGHSLCSLAARDGQLLGAVASRHQLDLGPGLEAGFERAGVEPEPLGGAADVERFVEAVVGRYLTLAARGRDDGEDGDEDDGLGPLPAFETTPPRPVQLLTREEIEAFHD